MKHFISFITLFLLTLIVSAQSFVDRIETDVEGEGRVRIVQDSRLTAIVNGDVPLVIDKMAERAAQTNDGKSVMKVKRRGYRIQVYQGGSTRADKAAAEREGNKVRQSFDLTPYTLYNNPEWVCRVGDFRTREEAAEYLHKIKAMFSGAMIVPSEIYVEK